MTQTQPWIGKSWIDLLFILLPPFLCLACIMLFPAIFQQQDGLSDAWWVVLILLVDVAHVYSTLYRTYFDKASYKEHKNKLLVIPFVSFIAGVLVYSYQPLVFWRLLAYVAVFHFIRQQYGFMRLYSRKENSSRLFRLIDTVTIYAATIYPVLFWHLSADRKFNWFVEGDFIPLGRASSFISFLSVCYFGLLAVYVLKELVFITTTKTVNWLRNAVIAGTVVSWYFGIVYYNGDMAFTLLNVVSHGVPYMALIWLYGKKSNPAATAKPGTIIRLVFSRYGLLLFLGIIFLLAFIEEGLWDITLWKEHRQLFSIFPWGDIHLSNAILTLLVPLLALPQITHYIIDGFIWKIKKANDSLH